MLIKRNAVSLIISQQKNVSISCGKFIKIHLKIKYEISSNLSEVLFREITAVLGASKKQILQDFTTDVRRENLQIKRGEIAFPPNLPFFLFDFFQNYFVGGTENKVVRLTAQNPLHIHVFQHVRLLQQRGIKHREMHR